MRIRGCGGIYMKKIREERWLKTRGAAPSPTAVASHGRLERSGAPAFIPFNRPHVVGREFDYISQAIDHLHLSGNGVFTQRCQAWLEAHIGCEKAFLTPSCTAALEMAALLTEIGPSDEIIMPSFTFVSTANAFVLRGGVPVFVDIRPDTLCLDETKITGAITPRTKAIVVVHYAGVGCEMDAILRIAERYGLFVIEDAAQGILSSYKERPLGSMGSLAAMSFHETKNVMAGEGGALLINDPRWVGRAEILREKGTNRQQFFRREVDKYTWMDIGSSYLPSEITAAFLWAQFEEAVTLTRKRVEIWRNYHEAFAALEVEGKVRRPVVPPGCEYNGHLYYLLLPDSQTRSEMLEQLNRTGVNAVFHYVPLHSSPAGKRYGRVSGDMVNTQKASSSLIRLPLWVGMSQADIRWVIEAVYTVLRERARSSCF
jgi:dTDP-4-amino-4,6-dideoxygalactose transaminase